MVSFTNLENAIFFKGPLSKDLCDIKTGENKVTIIHKFDFRDCEIWFVRFSMDIRRNVLALGNQVFLSRDFIALKE